MLTILGAYGGGMKHKPGDICKWKRGQQAEVVILLNKDMPESGLDPFGEKMDYTLWKVWFTDVGQVYQIVDYELELIG